MRTEGYIDDNKTELGNKGVEDLVRKNLINSKQFDDEIVKKLTILWKMILIFYL